MKQCYRFLVSYILNNQPNTLEVSSAKDSLNKEEAEQHIRVANRNKEATITDIRIVGLHHPTHPHVHPGHYQQPEG